MVALPFLSQRYAVRAAATRHQLARGQLRRLRPHVSVRCVGELSPVCGTRRRPHPHGSPDRHRRAARWWGADRPVDLRVPRAGRGVPGRACTTSPSDTSTAARPSRPVPRRLLRRAARGGLRRAEQRPRGLRGGGVARHPAGQSPTCRSARADGCARSAVRSPNSPPAPPNGDDYLRVWVKEPTRAGLRETVSDVLPNALEVRIDPEFADDRSTRTARPGTTQPHAGDCSRSTATRGGRRRSGGRAVRPAARPDHLAAPAAGAVMRPVLLDMEASRRSGTGPRSSSLTPTTSRWSGRPGPARSTVIDALTFALYGTVPRWEDRRGDVALAPTANRGVVRLVFDVNGAVRRRPRIAARRPTA